MSGVARTIGIARPGEGKTFYVRPKDVSYTALDGITPLSRLFRHHIPNLVHDIQIIACPTEHHIATKTAIEPVMTGSAIQYIVGTVTHEHVVQGISGPVDRRHTG